MQNLTADSGSLIIITDGEASRIANLTLDKKCVYITIPSGLDANSRLQYTLAVLDAIGKNWTGKVS